MEPNSFHVGHKIRRYKWDMYTIMYILQYYVYNKIIYYNYV